jgi:hypothetical protein
MPATATWCERNGAAPGSETSGIPSIDWKAIDDPGVTTPFTDPTAIIAAGTASYHKYDYIKFTGTFTTIGNVKFINQTGLTATGVTIHCQRTMTADSDRLPYTQPSRTIDNINITPTPFSTAATIVGVYVGGASADGVDGAASNGKANFANKPTSGFNGNALYTNYLCTQIQTTNLTSPGAIGAITLAVQYDES